MENTPVVKRLWCLPTRTYLNVLAKVSAAFSGYRSITRIYSQPLAQAAVSVKRFDSQRWK